MTGRGAPALAAIAALLVAPQEPACPEGQPLRRRHEALVARLTDVPPLRVCFVDHSLPDGAPGVLQGGVAYLDGRQSDDVLTARLAHLALHVREGLTHDADSATTAAAEARARAVEDAILASYPGARPHHTSTP